MSRPFVALGQLAQVGELFRSRLAIESIACAPCSSVVLASEAREVGAASHLTSRLAEALHKVGHRLDDHLLGHNPRTPGSLRR